MKTSYSWARMELQNLTTLLDLNKITLKVAKTRAFGYLGIEVKARTKEKFLKELNKAIEQGKDNE